MTEQEAVINGGYSHHTKAMPSSPAAPIDLANGVNHSHPSGTGRNKPKMFIRPQISVEEVDSPSPPFLYNPPSPLSPHLAVALKSCPNTPRGIQDVHLAVGLQKTKCHSLPAGVTLEEPHTSCDTTQDSDISSSDGRLSDDGDTLFPTAPTKDVGKNQPNRSESLDSELYLVDASSSDDSSNTESPPTTRRKGFKPERDSGVPEDDVFQDAEIDMCTEADTKLVDWAYRDFVPACRSLLHYCAEKETSLSVIQSNLRNLANSIGFFCTEQQKFTSMLKPQRGITLSISTDRFAKFSTMATDRKYANTNNNNSPTFSAKSSSTSITSTASSGFEGQESHLDRSYAVKILRSVSQSLIAPLLLEAEKGFTQDLYKAIVIALQKISWKVEACLSFNNSGKEFEIHTEIFDDHQILNVRQMMIKALPPEEPKLKSAAALGSRTSSISGCHFQNMSEAVPPATEVDIPPGYVPVTGRRTPNAKRRPSGQVFDRENLPIDLKSVVRKHDVETRPELRDHLADKPTPMRIRTSTMGDLMDSPRRNRTLSKYGSSSQLEGEEGVHEDSDDYFRPRAYRRTTISLSRKEVTSLGLTVAKRIDESILNEMHAKKKARPLPEPVQLEPEDDRNSPQNTLEEVHGRLHEKLTKEFDRIRSASMSNLLDEDNYSGPESKSDSAGFEYRRRANSNDGLLVERQDSESASSVASPTSPHLQKSFTILKKRSKSEAFVLKPEDEWVVVDTTSSSKSRRKAKKTKKVEKKPVEKSLSSSGKFTQSLLKHARALRSPSKSSRMEVLSKSLSSAQLLDTDIKEEKQHPRPTSALSAPVSPVSKQDEDLKSGTLPVRKSRMSTLARIVRKAKDKPSSKSFGKGDSRKRSSFAKWEQEDTGSGGMFTESIEQYSRNAVCSLPLEGEEQLLVSVDVAEKLTKTPRKRASSIISKDSANVWFEITVNTNMKQFGRHHYTILRPFKQLQQLYDSLAASHIGHACQLPERPDKKRKQKQQMEELLRLIAGNPDLRTFPPFVSFLMPDDSFGSFSEYDSEVSFELLMTFYTPDVYPGPPGSYHRIHEIASEDLPVMAASSPSRKQSSMHKRGSLHLMKRDGKEDPSTFVIREEGRDALIVAFEDERYVVVAGTFEKLVEQLACEEKPDPRFVTTFLLGYRHFATAMDLLTMLLRRFHMTVPPNATEEEIAYDEKWRYVIQLRVLDILTYWIKKCWPDFLRNPPVLDKVHEFIGFLKCSEDTNFQLAGTNLEKVVTEKKASSAQYALPASDQPDGPCRAVTSPLVVSTPPVVAAPPGTRTSVAQHTPVRRISSTGCDINTLTAIQLARQLTLIELELLRAIEMHELAVYTWEPNCPENKPYRRNIDAVIARFNKVSYWVASEICSVENVRQRGALLEKFIEVAKHCHEYKNFNTTISVVSGLSLAAVRRLKRSWEHVSERSVKAFDKLCKLMSPTNNHINYRRALSNVNRRDTLVPYFGVFMRDLTFFNDGNHKALKNGLLNFSKLRTIVLKFEEMKGYQRAKYFFPPEDKTRQFCRNLVCLSEQDLYDRSEVIEPRDPPPMDSPDGTSV